MRCVRRFLAGAAVLLLAPAAAVTLSAGAASATPASDGVETQLLTMLNTARQGAGLAPLAADAAIAQVARAWSGHMVGVHARTGDPVVKAAAPSDCEQSSLCHNPNLGPAVGALVPGWTRIGENIGVGGDPAAVNAALLASPGHFANIMGDYNRVGVGVVMEGTTLWATFDFANAPGAPTPAAAPAGPVSVVGTNGRYNPVAPVRIADTRTGHGVVPAGGIYEVPVAGVAGVPADATGVVVNLTAAAAQQAGYLTAYPCGAAAPTASNLNVTAGETRANQAAIALDSTKSICVFSSTATDVIIDLAGWYAPTGDAYQAQTPARVFDSRTAGGPATTFTVPVTGGSAVTVNVTVTNPAAAGYVSAYPCGMDAPLVSNVNFTAGQTIANLATVGVGTNHSICLTSSTPTNVDRRPGRQLRRQRRHVHQRRHHPPPRHPRRPRSRRPRRRRRHRRAPGRRQPRHPRRRHQRRRQPHRHGQHGGRLRRRLPVRPGPPHGLQPQLRRGHRRRQPRHRPPLGHRHALPQRQRRHAPHRRHRRLVHELIASAPLGLASRSTGAAQRRRSSSSTHLVTPRERATRPRFREAERLLPLARYQVFRLRVFRRVGPGARAQPSAGATSAANSSRERRVRAGSMPGSTPSPRWVVRTRAIAAASWPATVPGEPKTGTNSVGFAERSSSTGAMVRLFTRLPGSSASPIQPAYTSSRWRKCGAASSHACVVRRREVRPVQLEHLGVVEVVAGLGPGLLVLGLQPPVGEPEQVGAAPAGPAHAGDCSWRRSTAAAPAAARAGATGGA